MEPGKARGRGIVDLPAGITMMRMRMMMPAIRHILIFISFHHICFRTRLAPRRKPWAETARLSVLSWRLSRRSPRCDTLLMFSRITPTVSSICYMAHNVSRVSRVHLHQAHDWIARSAVPQVLWLLSLLLFSSEGVISPRKTAGPGGHGRQRNWGQMACRIIVAEERHSGPVRNHRRPRLWIRREPSRRHQKSRAHGRAEARKPAMTTGCWAIA